MSNVTDNFRLNATPHLWSMMSQICKISSTYVAVGIALAQSGEDNFRRGVVSFQLTCGKKLLSSSEQGLCASGSHGSHPPCLHLPRGHHHGLRLAQVSSLEEELLGLYQALTSRAFWLQVGFDQKVWVSGRVRVLAVLGCTELYWAVLGCTGWYWAALGSTWPHWAVLGGTGLY